MPRQSGPHPARLLRDRDQREGGRDERAGAVSRERRDGRRFVYTAGHFELRSDAAPHGEWTFPAPLGRQDVIGELTMADTVTIARHLKVPEIRSYMTVSALADLSSPDATSPSSADTSGRSAQTFVVEVVARSGSEQRRGTASGRDIYAVTAPLVVEAMERTVDGRSGVGVVTAGEAFDAQDFLTSLSRMTRRARP